MITDLSLVAQVTVSGDKRAFDELVRRYQSPVRRFFLNQTLGDSQLSDDLAQDTFIKAYINIGSFRGMASFKTWLMRIAYNVFYDHVRAHSSEAGQMQADYEGIVRHPESRTQDSELRFDIHSALSLLKPDERTCITLQLIDGYDIKAVAEITGMKEGTVKSHLSRGKEKMANYLRKNGYDRR
jgi:RNA polymerase sigma-70 factor (ECF subfamily)